MLSREPGNVDAHILLARVYSMQNDLQAVPERNADGLAACSSRSQSYLTLAAIQQGAKQTAEAEENFKKAVQLDSNSAPALLALGDFYVQQQRWADSEQQYRKAIGVEPKNRLARVALARMYLAQGQEGSG